MTFRTFASLALLVCSCACTLVLPALAESYSPQVQSILNEALSQFNQGQMSSARRSYESALAAEPRCPAAYNGLGLCAFREGDNAAALQNYQKALQIMPNHYQSLFNAANCLYSQSRYSDALSFFLRAKEARPEGAPESELLTMIGNVYRDKAQDEKGAEQSNNQRKAQACYQQAISQDPHEATPHANLGKLYADMRDFNKAETHLKTAVQLRKEYPFAYFELGCLEKSYGHAPEALIAFSLSLKYETEQTYRADTLKKIREMKIPESVAENFARGYQLLADGKLDAAEAEFETVAALPGSMQAAAWNNVGYIRAKQNKTQEALSAYQQAIKLMPHGLPATYYNLGQLMAGQGNSAEAEKWYRKALAEPGGGDDYLAHTALGVALVRNGKYDEALQHYNLAQMQSGDDLPVVHFNKGVLLAKQGRKAEAKKSLENYLRLAPKGYNAAAAQDQISKL